MSGPNRTEMGNIDYSQIGQRVDYIPFEFETMDWKIWYIYSNKNPQVAVITVISYIGIIFGIQRFMKTRKAFDLRRELFLWNFEIGIFSIIGFVRTLPEMAESFANNGFHSSICNYRLESSQLKFWSLLFALSKYVELGDTLFLILRKKELQVIQWYHHATTLMACWFMMSYMEPIVTFYGFMNYGVHSLMYPYFALKALDYKIPRQFATVITTLQLVQMLVGLFVNSYSTYFYYSSPSSCYRTPGSIKIMFALYGSFVLLFGHLFYKLVVQKKFKLKTQ